MPALDTANNLFRKDLGMRWEWPQIEAGSLQVWLKIAHLLSNGGSKVLAFCLEQSNKCCVHLSHTLMLNFTRRIYSLQTYMYMYTM